MATAKRHALRGLRGKLVVSHALVGLAVALVALVSAHLMQLRASRIEATSNDSAHAVQALSDEVDGAFEEGFAYVLARDPNDRSSYLRRFELMRAGRTGLLARSDFDDQERSALAALGDRMDSAEAAGRSMLDRSDRSGLDLGETIEAYETNMDRLRDDFDKVTDLVRDRASRDQDAARALADRAALGAGVLALFLATVLGVGLGRRLTGPLTRLRDAAIAFGRGEVDSISVTTSSDEIGDLARAFGDMSTNVKQLVATVKQRNADNRLVLDNIDQGLMTVDRALVMSAEQSAQLERWFGIPNPSETLIAYLARLAPSFAASTKIAWSQVSDGFMPVAVSLLQIPQRLVVGDQHFRFTYQPIGKGEDPERFLVVVSDVTAEVKRELAERSRNETLTLFEHVVSDRSGLLAFMDEASSLVTSVVARNGDDLIGLKRALHTLKGNCALFGLASVANVAHELETLVIDRYDVPPQQELSKLSAAWFAVSSDVERLIGAHRNMVEVPDYEHAALADLVQSRAGYDIIANAVRNMKLEPTRRRLHQFAEQSALIAQRLNKPSPVVEVLDGGLRLDPSSWAKFWSCFVHALRNAIDHGIESPSAREACGKSPEGHLTLRTLIDATGFVIEIEDDGRGIDWDSIRSKCVVRDVPCATHDDLVRALFLDGLSTASQTTEISGRGVGMGALLAATESLGGKLEVDSQEHRGARIKMTFPIAAMALEARKPVINTHQSKFPSLRPSHGAQS